MDRIKDEPLDEEELISVIEVEEHYIKPDPLCTDAMQETLEEPQFVICPPEQGYIYEAPVNDVKPASMVASPSLQPKQAEIPCNVCGKNFGGPAHLDRHVRTMHRLQCSQCEAVLLSKTELSNHLYSHPHPCELCSEMHQTLDQLKQHGLDVHSVHITKQFVRNKNNLVSNFKCVHCNEKFSTKSAFEVHRTPNLDTLSATACSLKLEAKSKQDGSKLISCENCSQKFNTQLQLYHHNTSTHGSKPFTKPLHPLQCTKCDKVFTSLPELRSHMICDFHPIPCEMCSESYTTPVQLKQHSIEKHGAVIIKRSSGQIVNFECVNCNQNFPSKSAFECHKTANFGEKFKCTKCDSVFKTDIHLCFHHKSLCGKWNVSGTQHSQVDDTAMQSFYCYWCPEKFTTNSQLQYHVALSHTKIDYQCPCCTMKYPTKFSLQWHIKTKHLHSRAIFKCDFCSKQYMRKLNLQHHIKANHLGIANICKLCQKSFSSPYGLKKHENNVHNMQETQIIFITEKTQQNSNENPMKVHQSVLQCKFCSKKYKHKHDLTNHIQTRHTGRKYCCKICNKSFSSKYIRIRHENNCVASKSNLSLKYFQCDFCTKQYKCKDSLRNHINVHHFGIKFTCQECNKSFESLYYLKCHQSNGHIGQLKKTRRKYLKCEFCEKKYKTKRYLKNHVNVEHLGYNWACKFCNELFVSRYLLIAHEISVHD